MEQTLLFPFRLASLLVTFASYLVLLLSDKSTSSIIRRACLEKGFFNKQKKAARKNKL